jgi:hypothetical protein
VTHGAPEGAVDVTNTARAAGRRLARDGGDSIFLLVRHPDPPAALLAVQRAASVALEVASGSLADRAPLEDADSGRFAVMTAPMGVLLTLVQPEPYDLIIEKIAQELRRQGVSCRITVPPSAEPLWTGTERVACVEVRIRLAGRPDPTRATAWIAEPFAVERAADAALRWISRDMSPAQRVIVSAGWALRLEAGHHDYGPLFREAIRATSEYDSASIYRVSAEGWRGAALQLPAGRLTLMRGLPASRSGSGESAFAEMREALSTRWIGRSTGSRRGATTRTQPRTALPW